MRLILLAALAAFTASHAVSGMVLAQSQSGSKPADQTEIGQKPAATPPGLNGSSTAIPGQSTSGQSGAEQDAMNKGAASQGTGQTPSGQSNKAPGENGKALDSAGKPIDKSEFSEGRTVSPETKGVKQPQGWTGPINTGSGGAPPESPQGQSPPGMQAAPEGSNKTTVEPATPDKK